MSVCYMKTGAVNVALNPGVASKDDKLFDVKRFESLHTYQSTRNLINSKEYIPRQNSLYIHKDIHSQKSHTTKFFIPVNEKAFSVNFFEIFPKSLMRCLSVNIYVYVYVSEYVHVFVRVCVDEEISRCPTHSDMYIYIHMCMCVHA